MFVILGIFTVSAYSQTSKLIGTWSVVKGDGTKVGTLKFSKSQNKIIGIFNDSYNVSGISYSETVFKFNIKGMSYSFENLVLKSNDTKLEGTMIYIGGEKEKRTAFVIISKI